MTPIVLHLTSLSAKIALLGGLAWIQLVLLRRAPAASRSRLCSLALIAIALIAAGELLLAPALMVDAPVFPFTATSAAQTSDGAFSMHGGSWIGILWLAGAAFMLVRAAAGRIALALLRRRSSLREKVSGLDVMTGDVETPILTGVLRPAIVLPQSTREWTGEQRRMVLTHELTHFRQGDPWSNLLAQVVRAAFWFHPVVWLLVARMSREQELTCDEAVVASGHSPHDYAAFLLDAVRNLRSREMFTCAMAGSGAGSLKARFAHLLDATPRIACTRRLAAALAVFASAAATLALVHPVWAQTAKAQSAKEKVYKVGDGVTQPAVLYKVDPEYTEEARRGKISGTVLLKTVITADGEADNMEVVRGVGFGLDQKAIDAVSKWRFRPGTKDGKPVAVWATIQINFRLLDRKP